MMVKVREEVLWQLLLTIVLVGGGGVGRGLKTVGLRGGGDEKVRFLLR